MFNTQKFGGYLSQLRKSADMTQSELAEKLAVTRQAVSGYERGDSFPDVSILVLIADIFGVTLDVLINSGEPTRGESMLLEKIATGNGFPCGTLDFSRKISMTPTILMNFSRFYAAYYQFFIVFLSILYQLSQKC